MGNLELQSFNMMPSFSDALHSERHMERIAQTFAAYVQQLTLSA